MTVLTYQAKQAIKDKGRLNRDITHVVFIEKNKKFVSSLSTVSAEGVERIKTKGVLRKLLPLNLAVVMVDEFNEVVRQIFGKVGNENQFNILLEQFDLPEKKAS